MASSSTSSSWWWTTIGRAAISAAIVLTTSQIVRAISRRRSAKGKPLPMPPGASLILGHIPVLAKYMKAGDHIDVAIAGVMKAYPDLGGFFKFDLRIVQFAAVCDASAAREIIVMQNLPKSPTYASLHPFLGKKTMVAAEGETWSRQRKAFTPGFAHAHLRNMVPVFVERCQLLLPRLQRAADSGTVIKMHDELTLLTMDVITQAILSSDLGFLTAEKPPELFHAFTELINLTASAADRPHLRWTRYLPWKWARFQYLQHEFDKHLIPLIKARLAAATDAERTSDSSSTTIPALSAPAPASPKSPQQISNGLGQASTPPRRPLDGAPKATSSPASKGPGRRQDILDLALASARADGGRLDLDDVLAQVKTFLFAGHDTTSSAVAFTVYEVSRHPHVQAALIEEVDRVCQGRHPTAEDMPALKYTTAVLKESLRYWPLGGTARMGPPGTVVNGYDVGGIVLYCSHIHIHRSTELWGPNAGEFVPERWLDEAYVAALHPMAFQPFSKGPRDCIGQTFALMEGKTLLAMLYQKFTFAYAGEQPEEQGSRITSYPRYHVPVTAHARADYPSV